MILRKELKDSKTNGGKGTKRKNQKITQNKKNYGNQTTRNIKNTKKEARHWYTVKKLLKPTDQLISISRELDYRSITAIEKNLNSKELIMKQLTINKG